MSISLRTCFFPSLLFENAHYNEHRPFSPGTIRETILHFCMNVKVDHILKTFEDALYEKIHNINFLDFELILYIKTLSLGLLCLQRNLASGSLSGIRSISHWLVKYVTLDLCGLLIYHLPRSSWTFVLPILVNFFHYQHVLNFSDC